MTKLEHMTESQRLYTEARALRSAGDEIWAHAKEIQARWHRRRGEGYRFYVADGHLPAGLHLDRWGGTISGTPSELGWFTLADVGRIL